MYLYILFYLIVSFLVGRGAHEWAVSHGIPPCLSEKMATSEFFLLILVDVLTVLQATFRRGALGFMNALD